MSFLRIPSEEGLFTAIKTRKSPEEEAARSDDEEDEEDDDAEVIRLIPRCSPVPRKRGASIYDETAEYMRIHLALSAGKRVSFADTTGGDLTDVKEFVAFDTDEEEESARWEEEEAKYRKPRREPTYGVRPGFTAFTGDALLRAVRTNKVEVEKISPVESEPLSFSGLVRVYNVSFHKAVYIRATSDSWASYFDHPAEYVQGSHDGDTDQFGFKLSFAPPYVTHGSRIEFVVRYETSEGDFWANNFSLNYAVSLLVTYEDEPERRPASVPRTRGILKPPKVYSMNDVFDSEDEQEKTEGRVAETAGLTPTAGPGVLTTVNSAEDAGATRPELFRPVPVTPAIVQPELDIETGTDPKGPSVPPAPDRPSVDSMLSTRTVSPGEDVPSVSPEAPPAAHLPSVSPTSVSLRPEKLQPCCEISSHATDEPTGGAVSPPPPPPAPSARQDGADGEDGRPSEDSHQQIPTTNMNQPALAQEKTDPEPTGPAPTVTFDPGVAEGVNPPTAGCPEGPTSPASHHESSLATGETWPRSEGETPENRTLSPDVSNRRQSSPGQDVSETEDASHNPLNSSPEASELQTELDISLVSSAVLLGGIVSVCTVLQEPNTLFCIGLLLVLQRL